MRTGAPELPEALPAPLPAFSSQPGTLFGSRAGVQDCSGDMGHGTGTPPNPNRDPSDTLAVTTDPAGARAGVLQGADGLPAAHPRQHAAGIPGPADCLLGALPHLLPCCNLRPRLCLHGCAAQGRRGFGWRWVGGRCELEGMSCAELFARVSWLNIVGAGTCLRYMQGVACRARTQCQNDMNHPNL